MGVIHLRHRYLIRQYIYPFLIILFILLLIKWTTEPRSQPIGRQGHEYETFKEYLPVQKPTQTVIQSPQNDAVRMPTEPVEHLPHKVLNTPNVLNVQKELPKQLVDNAVELRPPQTSTKTLDNVINLVVYMESQCPDTTGFIRRNLLPTWKKLGHLNRLNVTIVPFGKAKCTPIEVDGTEDFSCECQHGSDECALNALDNCIIENKVHARDYIPLIGCVQGSMDLDTAVAQCLSNDPNKEWLLQCASSKRGRYLLAMAGQRTEALGNQFNFVPWVVLNGDRNIDSFYALEENVCKLLQPQPIECQSEAKNKVQNVL